MGPLRGLRTKRPRHVNLLRMKKTAPCGSIKDEKDRASWILFGKIRMKKTAPAGVRAVVMGPLRGLRTKRPRHVDLLRMKKTAPHGVRAVLMGPLREIRTKKTAPRGSKDEKDRATWI